MCGGHRGAEATTAQRQLEAPHRGIDRRVHAWFHLRRSGRRPEPRAIPIARCRDVVTREDDHWYLGHVLGQIEDRSGDARPGFVACRFLVFEDLADHWLGDSAVLLADESPQI